MHQLRIPGYVGFEERLLASLKDLWLRHMKVELSSRHLDAFVPFNIGRCMIEAARRGGGEASNRKDVVFCNFVRARKHRIRSPALDD